MISLKISEKLNGPKVPLSMCPQDGARLITMLEKISKDSILETMFEITKDFLQGKTLFKDIFQACFAHTVCHGTPPKYFAGRWLLTNDFKKHEKNMKYFEHIFDDRPDIITVKK